MAEAFEYLKTSRELSTRDAETLQKATFYGKEKKGLAYIIGTMNMILHGVEAPNIVHTNTLAENLADIQEKDRYDIVLANPPFGGKAGVVIKNTFLSNTDNASISLRKQLLESCNLHTVLDLPGGTFTGAGVKTVVLFFDKVAPTGNVWFYQFIYQQKLKALDELKKSILNQAFTGQLQYKNSEQVLRQAQFPKIKTIAKCQCH